MNQTIYEKLKSIAKDGQTITYGEIAPLVNVDLSKQEGRNRLSWILGEISEFEQENGRPMLSAVVIRKGYGDPGSGFFNLAQELGVYGGADNNAFFVNELKIVHEYWGARKYGGG